MNSCHLETDTLTKQMGSRRAEIIGTKILACSSLISEQFTQKNLQIKP